MNPAFAYRGLRMRMARVVNGQEVVEEPLIESGDQFARMIDHMSQCVKRNVLPHTPGEEGLQDMRIIEAIYESARSAATVVLPVPSGTRGPDAEEES
jgi:predicted dehydrogenase